jgi:hypothetical protein
MSNWKAFTLAPEPVTPVIASGKVETALTASAVGGGSRFRIPLLVPEGVATGDGRVFSPMSLRSRDLPLPLLWQIKTGTGHDGSVIVGRIDHLERVANGLGNAYGVFDNSPHAQEAERLVRNKFLRGVSADLDQFEGISEIEPKAASNGDDDNPNVERIVGPNITVSRARVMAATLVPRPAFQECFIVLDDESNQEAAVPDGDYTDTSSADDALVACAAISASIPVEPPVEWFKNPNLREPTPLSIDDNGRVFGHIAAWHVDHIGLPFGTRPPRSRSNYAYFHTGVIRTVEGEDIPVGQLTLAGGHAPLEATAAAAVKHYDDTASAVADVHAGEDAYGIWVAGALRPGTTPEQVRALRASAPSGDWRPINGRLEMVAVCQVNVPGFPLARARVASGHVMALVAAGASALAQLRGPSLEERVMAMEAALTPAPAEDPRLASVRARMESLTAGLDESVLLAYIDTETREDYASKGWAMKDGSFPIKDKKDLRNAIRAYGRAKDKDAAKKHIKKRARAIGAWDEIPESWLSIEDKMHALSIRVRGFDPEAREEAVARVASLRFRKREFQEEMHPRDDHGKFRHTVARLKDDLQKQAGTKAAVDALTRAEEADDAGDPVEAQRAVDEALDIVDKVAAETISPDTYSTLRHGYEALSEALFEITRGQDADEKLRYTDLPLPLRDLIEDLTDRLSSEAKAETYEELAGPLNTFKSGGDYMSMNEIRKHLSGIFRTLLR